MTLRQPCRIRVDASKAARATPLMVGCNQIEFPLSSECEAQTVADHETWTFVFQEGLFAMGRFVLAIERFALGLGVR